MTLNTEKKLYIITNNFGKNIVSNNTLFLARLGVLLGLTLTLYFSFLEGLDQKEILKAAIPLIAGLAIFS